MQHQQKNPVEVGMRGHRRGFELIEILVSLGLVSVLFIVLLAVQSVMGVQTNAYNKVLARQLLVEESEALRNASFANVIQPYTGLSPQFIETAYSNGNWTVIAPANPQSGARTYTVQGATGTNDPSKQVVPAGRLGDGVYEVYFRAQNGSASSWGAGFYFRYHDYQNYYLLQATATDLTLTKVVRGAAPVTVWTAAQAFTKNVWYQLTVDAAGSAINISLNGVHQGATPTATDSAFATGQFVLSASGNGIIDFDSIHFTNKLATPTALTWDFDGANETVGKTGYAWKSITPADLPSGTTALAITDAHNGFTDLKKAVLTVTWTERNKTKTYTNSFYLNQQSLAL